MLLFSDTHLRRKRKYFVIFNLGKDLSECQGKIPMAYRSGNILLSSNRQKVKENSTDLEYKLKPVPAQDLISPMAPETLPGPAMEPNANNNKATLGDYSKMVTLDDVLEEETPSVPKVQVQLVEDPPKFSLPSGKAKPSSEETVEVPITLAKALNSIPDEKTLAPKGPKVSVPVPLGGRGVRINH